MKIVLSGVETNNKGAELMLYAILQEIERKWPEAEVYVPANAIRQGLDYVHTTLKLRYWPLDRFLKLIRLNGVMRHLHRPLVRDTYAIAGADYFLNASGFCFSDQCKLWGTTPEYWEQLLKRLFKNGTKIVFLPQAFGPIELDITRKAVSTLGCYASVIMPREKTSYGYLEKSRLVNMKKVQLFTDFTSLVKGIFPSQYENLRNGICIIPNVRMIDKGAIEKVTYTELIKSIVKLGMKSGHVVYLLNHEGVKDEQLAKSIQKEMDYKIDVVTGLNALEVKGLIASAYLVVSSRFHGAASALNSSVPCLATSWSHKYKELFNDYDMTDCILPLNDEKTSIEKVNNVLNVEVNQHVREILNMQVLKIKRETIKMWNMVWNC